MENEQGNITSEFDDLPRCHYCERYAFEIRFQEIAVCDHCLETMTAGHTWRVVRDATGGIWVTSSETAYDYEILGEGTFAQMWALCHKDDPSNG